METYPRVSVVIPARNEEHNLLYVLLQIPHFVGEVILINGRSTDATVVVVPQMCPNIGILRQVRLTVTEVSSVEYPRLYGKRNLRTLRDSWRVCQIPRREICTIDVYSLCNV
jgi:cellulose synthase/poly-beta-1,6-N-acetylglucosamine synthase-like glycosyltransferase